VLDNGPSEKTARVAKSFGGADIAYLPNEKNLGGWKNMNKAFDLCDTDYLNIFHDDDHQLPWMIESEAAILDSMPEVGVVVCSDNHMMGEKKPKAPKRIRGKFYPKYEFIKALCDGKSRVAPPSPLFRMSEVKKHNLRFKTDIGGPGDFYMWLSMNEYLNVYAMDYPMLEYRMHTGDNPSLESSSFADSSLSPKDNDDLSSFIKIDDYLKKLKDEGHEINLKKNRLYFAEVCMKPVMTSFLNGEISLDDLLEKKARFDERYCRTGSSR
jgi:glycosyltransferase involved in cell wall biosynthesis